jgi:hypothetical protein
VRVFSEEDENARQAVGASIRRTTENIRKFHPALAAHLDALIKRGVRCWYEGDGTGWTVELL